MIKKDKVAELISNKLMLSCCSQLFLLKHGEVEDAIKEMEKFGEDMAKEISALNEKQQRSADANETIQPKKIEPLEDWTGKSLHMISVDKKDFTVVQALSDVKLKVTN